MEGNDQERVVECGEFSALLTSLEMQLFACKVVECGESSALLTILSRLVFRLLSCRVRGILRTVDRLLAKILVTNDGTRTSKQNISIILSKK